ncbi:cytochrome P450 [Endozoicomonas sp. ALC020]|uniref:cytochrome P450 n=1 Tax=Endozoicomonas sp. ALC020 TaxID=3403077 RepID=UPI003BAFF42B
MTRLKLFGRKESMSSAPQVPGPTGLEMLKVMKEGQRDILSTLMSLSNQYGDIVRFRYGLWPACLVTHPDHVRHVLQTNNRNYDKGNPLWDMSRWFFREGLLTSEGEFWRRQRRLAQPAFHHKRIATFAELMVEETVKMLAAWVQKDQEEEEAAFDMAAEMGHLTARIVSTTLFGVDVEEQAEAIHRQTLLINSEIGERFRALLPLPPVLPTPRDRRFRAAQKELNDAVEQMISRHRQDNTERGNLLSMLMHARDEETNEQMTDQQLRDEVLIFFTAGTETTANALAWCSYLLSTHPTVRRRLWAEIDEVSGGRRATLDDLPKLSYTRMVFLEAMRLFPPAWLISRRAVADDEIAGYHIPADTMIFTSPYVTHRHATFWPNPEGFEPERFEKEREIKRFAYFPFGGGPRQCIGNQMAMMEGSLILATLCQQYRLDLVAGHPIALEPLITLAPRHGIMMTRHRRQR